MRLTTLLAALAHAAAARAVCFEDNCYRNIQRQPSAAAFCATFTTSFVARPTALPDGILSSCGVARLSSACSCVYPGAGGGPGCSPVTVTETLAAERVTITATFVSTLTVFSSVQPVPLPSPIGESSVPPVPLPSPIEESSVPPVSLPSPQSSVPPVPLPSPIPESSVPPVPLPSPISESIPPVSLPSPISESSVPPVPLPSPIDESSSVPPVPLPSPISESSVPPVSLPSPIS